MLGAMTDFAELSRLIENLVRVGTIAEIDLVKARVRVRTGDLLTGWLPWTAVRAGADRDWDPPTVNEQVLLLSPSGQLANGVAITGLFSTQHPANGDRANLHRRTYSDGAVIEYDSQAHHLSAHLPAGGTTELISDGGVHIVGDVTLEGDLIQTGNQQVTGNVQVSIDVVAAGISLVHHVHGGVQGGGSNTGVPK